MGFEVRHRMAGFVPHYVKRCVDFLGALAGLILLSPVYFLIAVIIKLDSSGPIFYNQVRVGYKGKKFKMVKFRTMRRDADQLLEKCLKSDPALQEEWEKYQKLRNDPRVTRVGRILRRYSIDEFPQLWNVLLGEMSLVGPRPFFPAQKEIYGDAYRQYIKVRPGITGLWQVSGRNESSFLDRAQWDVYYVSNWSSWLDIYILMRTFVVVLRRDGAY